MLAFSLDRALALREYLRYKEDKMNQAEYISSFVRALQASFGKKFDKEYAQAKYSTKYQIADYDEVVEEENVTQVKKEEIPWWADPKKRDVILEEMEEFDENFLRENTIISYKTDG